MCGGRHLDPNQIWRLRVFADFLLNQNILCNFFLMSAHLLAGKSYFREGYGEKATFLEVTSQRIVDIFSGNRFLS